jgi:hypothetical protein
MVSPPYKGGYGVFAIDAVSPDGEGVAFNSPGAFAGVEVKMPLGDVYMAHRQAEGWQAAGLEPPSTRGEPGGSASVPIVDYSSSLRLALWHGCVPAGVNTLKLCEEATFLSHDTGVPSTYASWEQMGELLSQVEGGVVIPFYRSASADFCHVVFSNAGGGLVGAAKGTDVELYDLASGCGEGSSLHIVGADNKGLPIDPYCAETLGYQYGNTYHAVSADGLEIFFTQNVGVADKEDGCHPIVESTAVASNPEQLFVRLDGVRTVEVSRPFGPSAFGGCGEGGKPGEVPGEVPCPGAVTRPPAVFWGASEDGSVVYFTTVAQLTAGDSDPSRNLYMARIGCPAASPGCEASEREVVSLARVAEGSSASEEAKVRGVVKVAPDGSRVAFVAGGVLTSEPGPEGHLPVKGADNLYVYDGASGHAGFLAELCSGPGRSGSVADARCPTTLEETQGDPDEFAYAPGNDTDLWFRRLDTKEAQFNVCGRPTIGECEGARETGRFLVFSSYGRLLKDDTDDSKDIYRYDVQTGLLERMSVGEGGYEANGNCADTTREAGCDVTMVVARGSLACEPAAVCGQHGLVDRAIDEDGSRMVFAATERLSPIASNGLQNVYEWRQQGTSGTVSIVSTGSSSSSDTQAVITPSGRDIFFVTSQGLLGEDGGVEPDVYDARIGGGFPKPPGQPERCAGEACKGPLTEPPPASLPASMIQPPANDQPSAAAKRRAKPQARKTKRGKRHRVIRRTRRHARHSQGRGK